MLEALAKPVEKLLVKLLPLLPRCHPPLPQRFDVGQRVDDVSLTGSRDQMDERNVSEVSYSSVKLSVTTYHQLESYFLPNTCR